MHPAADPPHNNDITTAACVTFQGQAVNMPCWSLAQKQLLQLFFNSFSDTTMLPMYKLAACAVFVLCCAGLWRVRSWRPASDLVPEFLCGLKGMRGMVTDIAMRSNGGEPQQQLQHSNQQQYGVCWLRIDPEGFFPAHTFMA
jgi:hypothetical protein